MALLAGVGLGFNAWLADHDARLKMELTLHDTERERDKAKAELAANVSVIEKEKAAVKTPAQAVQVINRWVPLPTPLHIEPEMVSAKNLPDKPTPKPLIIPHEDVIPFSGYVEDCRICKAKLDASLIDNAKLTKERDLAVKTVKGGSWIHRVVRNAKWLALGAAVGAGAVAAAKH